MSKKTNSVRINMNPIDTKSMYSGNINNEKFTISYDKSFSSSREEYIESIDILWEKPQNQKRDIYEEAIKKIFRNKLNAEESK